LRGERRILYAAINHKNGGRAKKVKITDTGASFLIRIKIKEKQ
jgi:hypothetical protein